ncbi:MAG: hypothetical protein ACRENB_08880 [Gemmatimonadales bacterium]
MTSAVSLDAPYDRTHLQHVLRGGVALGLLQTVLITLFAFLQPRLAGPAELLICGAILVVGLVVTVVLPGRWTEARTIEGIAGAAGIGLAATVVFLVVDVILLQRIGLYTNRWLAIGGGSNWWYHPVWWMTGTYLAWLGAWVQANQAARHRESSPIALALGLLVLTAIVMAVAVMTGFPGARFGLGTFGVASLPALAILTAVSGVGVPRR